MAEDMGNAAGIYCSKDWWDRSSSLSFMSNSLSPFCSTGMLDDECFLDINGSMNYCSGSYTKSRSCKEASLDSPARVSERELNITTADYPITGPLLSSIWNYGSGGTGDHETSNVGTIVFQEEMGASDIENWSEKGFPSNGVSVDSTTNAFKHINQELSNNLDQSGPTRCTTLPFGYSPLILQRKMDPQEITTGNHSSMMNLKSSHSNQFTGVPILSNVLYDSFGSFQPNPSPSQVDVHSIRGHVACRKDIIMKLTKEYIGDSMLVLSEGEYEPAYKRARIETALPMFKVRKDKLGDRVTALQQLVSPFGKTDTASVLHEAVDCIKFLHDQITTIVNMHKGRNGLSFHSKHQMTTEAKDGEDPEQVLRSQGLCLVNISCLSVYAKEPRSDPIWTPDLLRGTF